MSERGKSIVVMLAYQSEKTLRRVSPTLQEALLARGTAHLGKATEIEEPILLRSDRWRGHADVMPTVFRSGPYRFFFYSSDREEPPHVHVERDQSTAKFWLGPVRLQSSGGFGAAEVRRIQRLVERHRDALSRSWDAYFET